MNNKYIYDEIDGKEDKSLSRMYLWRQVLVSSGVWLSFFSLGLSFGISTVLVPQLRKEANSTVAVSDNLASWIAAAPHYGIVIALPLILTISWFNGRRQIFLGCSIITMAAFILLYLSSDIVQILISQFMQGVNGVCVLTINLAIMAEYTSPKYRGVLFSIKTAMMFWGIWVSNAIGTYFHWRKIGIIGIISSTYALLTSIFWPESPFWLAEKHQIEECAKSHRWLKGNNKVSRKELELILKDINDDTANRTKGWKNNFIVCKKVLFKKEFYKSTMVGMMLICMYHSTGKLVISIYAIEIIKKICKNEKVAYDSMLILDAVSVFSMYLGCIVAKFVKRRTMYFSLSIIGVITLFSMSLYLYLIHILVVYENKYISIVFLVILSMSVSMGPILLSTTLIGEVIPLKLRMFSLFIIMFVSMVLTSNLVKLTPSMFVAFKTHGSFLLYGIMSSVFLLLLYYYLPETKDKTLHEIRELMIDNNGDKIEIKQ